MITWKFNDNIDMELPEATLECFDKFVKETMLSIFLPEDAIKGIREKFKKDYGLKE
jgi:hypothetical protein